MEEAAADIGEESMVRLDLRGVACPMNFVKTRLKLDKMATGELLEVLLDSGEPIESVSSSVLSEGHLIESSTFTLLSPLSEGQMLSAEQPGYHRLIIRKTSAA
ncbi:MAG: sulfurtransferase TusA family protein [Candidatus Melainabacteria bacterium]|nr:sulfurtransferase TusA family protein [Candidatus Melainabacteria bacterium]